MIRRGIEGEQDVCVYIYMDEKGLKRKKNSKISI